MKMAAKMKSFSGQAQQKLPGATATAAGKIVPVRFGRVSSPDLTPGEAEPGRGARGKSQFAGLPAISTPETAQPQIQAISPEALDLPRIAVHNDAALERTQVMVDAQAVRLRESGADELHVVIKPDAGLQLSLGLRRHDGAVEVQAVLDHGNFDLLNRHWPELQQQLEARGVRVAPLSCAEFFGGGSEGFRQPTPPHGQPAGDDAEPAKWPAALSPVLPTAAAAASASASRPRQWETWA